MVPAERWVMLRIATGRVDAPLVRASVGNLPFVRGSLGAAVSGRMFSQLAAVDHPLALADLHRCLVTDALVSFDFLVGGDTESVDRLRDLLEGAGFVVESEDRTSPGVCGIQARRRLTLPDTVGTDMAVLVCGLNPSIHAAEAGVGFVTASNRFWSGAQAAGLVTVDRDPVAALKRNGVGMTDLVKRATRRADELDAPEYLDGLARVERLVAWLQPRVVCFVGLSGWRAAVDRRSVAGLQETELAGRPVYVMPSTSGLNARCQLPEVVEHFTEVRRLAER